MVKSLFKPKDTLTLLLTQAFGVSFHKAERDQKLALIECCAFLMRQPQYSLRDALAAIEPEVRMPPAIAHSRLQLENLREGLVLLALLYAGINRDYGGLVPSEDQ